MGMTRLKDRWVDKEKTPLMLSPYKGERLGITGT
jgi:hypothetical protein